MICTWTGKYSYRGTSCLGEPGRPQEGEVGAQSSMKWEWAKCMSEGDPSGPRKQQIQRNSKYKGPREECAIQVKEKPSRLGENNGRRWAGDSQEYHLDQILLALMMLLKVLSQGVASMCNVVHMDKSWKGYYCTAEDWAVSLVEYLGMSREPLLLTESKFKSQTLWS